MTRPAIPFAIRNRLTYYAHQPHPTTITQGRAGVMTGQLNKAIALALKTASQYEWDVLEKSLTYLKDLFDQDELEKLHEHPENLTRYILFGWLFGDPGIIMDVLRSGSLTPQMFNGLDRWMDRQPGPDGEWTPHQAFFLELRWCITLALRHWDITMNHWETGAYISLGELLAAEPKVAPDLEPGDMAAVSIALGAKPVLESDPGGTVHPHGENQYLPWDGPDELGIEPVGPDELFPPPPPTPPPPPPPPPARKQPVPGGGPAYLDI